MTYKAENIQIFGDGDLHLYISCKNVRGNLFSLYGNDKCNMSWSVTFKSKQAFILNVELPQRT
jgi:hypothetical protein